MQTDYRKVLNVYENTGILEIPESIHPDRTLTLSTIADEILNGNCDKAQLLKDSNHGIRAALLDLSVQKEALDQIEASNLGALAAKLLQSTVYPYQCRLNPNYPFSQSEYLWHQDYYYWSTADGMQKPMVVTIGVLLDDVNHFNGPTVFITGSHKHGLVKHIDIPTIKGTLEQKLPFLVPQSIVEQEMQANSLVAAVGKAGSIFAFNANVIHRAMENLSCYQRRILFIIFASTELNFKGGDETRPLWLANKYNKLGLPVYGA